MPVAILLYVDDPIVQLDLSEMLAEILEDVEVVVAYHPADVVAALTGAVRPKCLISCATHLRILEIMPLLEAQEMPHIHIGFSLFREKVTQVDLPFRIDDIKDALHEVGLVSVDC